MHRIAQFLLAILLLVAFACGRSEKLKEAAISEDLKDKGTRELLAEAAEDNYEAPADGRLTEKQIEIYLAVREHEKKIAQVAKKELEQHGKKVEASGEKTLSGAMASFQGLGSLADLMTADIRAARELGYNSAEYQWIKSKVLEASGSQMQQQMAQASASMMDSAISQMKQQHAQAQDETTKKMYAQMIAEDEKNKATSETPPEDPAIAYNRELLSKHENALNALATEMAKYTTDAEAEKAVGEWQKNLDQAVEDAKTTTDGSTTNGSDQ